MAPTLWLQARWAIALWRSPLVGTLGGSAIALMLVAPAQAAQLTNWQFDPATQQLTITVPGGTTPRYFLLAQPARIVLDLPNTQVGEVPEQRTYTGAVRQIRVAQFQPDLTRIVIELSSDAVLAARQVELQRAGAENGRGDRWMLRPLLVGASVAATPAPSPTPAPVTPVPITPAPITPAPVASAPMVQPPTTAPLPSPPAISPVAPNPTSPVPEATAPLPPLEPGAIELPVETSVEPPPLEPGAIELPVEVAQPEPAAPEAIARSPRPPSAPATPVAPAPNPSTPPTPTALPPAISSGDRSVTVSVPSLATATPPSAPTTAAPTAAPTAPLPPARPAAPQPGQVSVPSLQPRPTLPPAPVAAAPPASPATVEFGQPLSVVAPGAGESLIVAASFPVLIPAGTTLRLRYPGNTALELNAEVPWQEVLLLDQTVVDSSGQVIAPAGSQVIGRFETGREGSRFVTQAISIQARNLRLQAQSGVLDGDRREVSRNDLLRNSALGAVAGTVLGGGMGLIGGAAAGAATTFLTAPQPAVIQPNQVIEVRLVEALMQ